MPILYIDNESDEVRRVCNLPLGWLHTGIWNGVGKTRHLPTLRV
jgi:hypothetical protein